MTKYKQRVATLLCATSTALLLGGCPSTPPTDSLVSAGGTSPDPAAVLAGAVVYRGPRPSCRYENGKAVEVQGIVVLTLFDYDNPPPPEGNATTAISFATVSAKRLFPHLRVCLPEKPSAAERAETINATATFEWSAVPLGKTCEEDGKAIGEAYRIHALFDRDQDFHPLFGVRSQATRGDVAGAAYTDPQARDLKVARIEVGHVSKHPNGQRIEGLVVSVNQLIHTERPVFRISRTAKPLSSEKALPLAMLFGDLASRTEGYKGALADEQFALDLIPKKDRARYAPALAAAGFSLDYDPAGYAWHVEGIDANLDGKVDEHPLLPGIPYTTPALFMDRARTPAEVTAGVPPVVLLGASMDVGATADPLTLPMLVTPMAVMRLPKASGGTCDVPMIPPANVSSVFEMVPGAFECQELPTGEYGATVLHGVQGGALGDNSNASDRFDFPTDGECLAGVGSSCARNSFTAWTIPNDLGPLDSEYNPAALDQLHDPSNPDEPLWVDEQGPKGRYLVVDPEPRNDPKAGCDVQKASPALSCDCCASIADLCEQDLPACKRDKRGVAIITTDKDGKLACLPFELPKSCCNGKCIKETGEPLPSEASCEP